jgi:hypothetical protein
VMIIVLFGLSAASVFVSALGGLRQMPPTVTA